jgi:hypothetical protein
MGDIATAILRGWLNADEKRTLNDFFVTKEVRKSQQHVVERPDPCITRPTLTVAPTASTAPFLFPALDALCVCTQPTLPVFSLLPVCAACAACGLALFSNDVFRVCVRIN